MLQMRLIGVEMKQRKGNRYPFRLKIDSLSFPPISVLKIMAAPPLAGYRVPPGQLASFH